MKDAITAVMQGVVQGHASRQVAAAVASAILRTCASFDTQAGHDHVSVPVPGIVADDVPIIGASLASQRIAEDIAGVEFHDAGQAEMAMRNVLRSDVLRDFRI